MTVAEMHNAFLHYYDKQSNFAAPEVTSDEIDIYLNYAQHEFLKLLVEKGLEKSQEWLDYTKNITRRVAIAPASNTGDNKPFGQFVTLPTGSFPSFGGGSSVVPLYKLALSEEASITYPNPCNTGQTITSRVPVVPLTRDEYIRTVKNPFRSPWREEIYRLTADDNQFELVGFQGCTINTYYLDYLEELTRISLILNRSCQLEYKAGVQIVEMAVNFALQTMGDQRLATKQYDKLIKTI